jgi:hypothetical protein
VLPAVALAFLVSSPAAPPASPIRIDSLERETPDGPVRAWIARVDLTDPRVSFVVTGPLERRPDDPPKAEARLVPTDAWAETARVDLAVNAGFFDRLDAAAGLLPGWTEGLPVDILGLARSEGRTISPPGRFQGAPPDPALLIDEMAGGRCPCAVRAAYADGRGLDGIEDVVAGIGPRGGKPGTLLVETGQDRGATARVDPMVHHPRTAAGVSRDGKTLLLMVVDGRRDGWSVGVTLPALARMMLDAGAWNAVNLDGGGSSALWYRAPGEAGGRVLNRPSDGRVRPVATHLGVRVHAGAPPRSSR